MAANIDWLSRARLYSGLVLLAYVASHLSNHALGIVSLDAMEGGRAIFLGLWRNPVGTVALYGALAVHAALVLHSLFRRRTLRMSRVELAQMIMGFAIVPLLALHVSATRGLHEFFGLDDRYAYVLASIYVFVPVEGLKQSVTVIAVWLHGAVGLHFWLRLKPAYQRWRSLLFAIALLLPTLALAGFMSAGREVELLLRDPAWAAAMRASVDWPSQQAGAWALATRDQAIAAGLVLPLLVLATRLLRELMERRRGLISLTYPRGRLVTIKPGLTVLEASRSAGIPHASVCGGRGRCSTCRVRVGEGGGALAPPNAEERRVLARVGAPAGVRLACQIRPTAPLELTPLLPPDAQARDAFQRPAHLRGSEREIAVLFADIRAFTGFAEGRLPFDVVFFINQYFQAMGAEVERAGGRVDKFIGDGVMALFGVESEPEQACAQALAAARGMAGAMAALNHSLRDDLEAPLRIGIGIHVGPVIVGEMGYSGAMSVTAIGDAVNTSSRLEQMTKEFGCQLVVSDAVARRAGADLSAFPGHEIEVRGRRERMKVYAIEDALALPAQD